MLHTLFKFLIVTHVLAGAVALSSFWIPIFARKGRGVHRRFGTVFAYTMMFTAATAALASVMTMIAPLATHPDATGSATSLRLGNGLMLAYLASITFVAAFSGLRAIRMRGNHAGHRSASEVSANVVALILALATLLAGWAYGSTLLMAISAIGLLGVPGNLRFIFTEPRTNQEWLFQHMGSMIGAGIAAHTAFLIFGVARLAPSLASEPLIWLSPTLIGLPASALWRRHYRRRLAPGQTADRGTALPNDGKRESPPAAVQT